MRMKRPQGYKHIKCPYCKEKIRLVFRTLHRLKVEVDDSIPPVLWKEKEEEGDYRG